MLDEPSLGLAPQIVESIFDTILELNAKRGLTVLLVEQNAQLALSAATFSTASPMLAVNVAPT